MNTFCRYAFKTQTVYNKCNLSTRFKCLVRVRRHLKRETNRGTLLYSYAPAYCYCYYFFFLCKLKKKKKKCKSVVIEKIIKSFLSRIILCKRLFFFFFYKCAPSNLIKKQTVLFFYRGSSWQIFDTFFSVRWNTTNYIHRFLTYK